MSFFSLQEMKQSESPQYETFNRTTHVLFQQVSVMKKGVTILDERNPQDITTKCSLWE